MLYIEKRIRNSLELEENMKDFSKNTISKKNKYIINSSNEIVYDYRDNYDTEYTTKKEQNLLKYVICIGLLAACIIGGSVYICGNVYNSFIRPYVKKEAIIYNKNDKTNDKKNTKTSNVVTYNNIIYEPVDKEQIDNNEEYGKLFNRYNLPSDVKKCGFGKA